MGQQRLHSALAPIDVLTRLELEEVMHKGLNDQLKQRYTGIDTARLPPITVQGNGGTVNLGAISTQDPFCGPEQGDIWMLRRVNVTSSAFTTDQARYVVFRGSTPSDFANSYTNRQLLDGQTSNGGAASNTVSQPAVPATGVAQQNTNQFPVQVVISPNGATITNVSVNGVTVGTAAGTYTVPANGSISIAYSVATPTWVWTGLNTLFQIGQLQSVAYQLGNKACVIQPGEQVYAQVYNTTVGNTYLLTGEAIRCPAEMKGKLLG